ncbi:hypothetical protein PUN28_014927 [Cardiocondyla obscurior]|uniref:Uncharacterized protein n=1 Tax=Cardiocondyla obscurior TaxID=286306 RepID=A0AAW2EW57_9HYME
MSKDKNAAGRNYSVCARYRLSRVLSSAGRGKPFRRRSQQSSDLVYMRRRDSSRSIARRSPGTKNCSHTCARNCISCNLNIVIYQYSIKQIINMIIYFLNIIYN